MKLRRYPGERVLSSHSLRSSVALDDPPSQCATSRKGSTTRPSKGTTVLQLLWRAFFRRTRRGAARRRKPSESCRPKRLIASKIRSSSTADSRFSVACATASSSSSTVAIGSTALTAVSNGTDIRSNSSGCGQVPSAQARNACSTPASCRQCGKPARRGLATGDPGSKFVGRSNRRFAFVRGRGFHRARAVFRTLVVSTDCGPCSRTAYVVDQRFGSRAERGGQVGQTFRQPLGDLFRRRAVQIPLPFRQ